MEPGEIYTADFPEAGAGQMEVIDLEEAIEEFCVKDVEGQEADLRAALMVARAMASVSEAFSGVSWLIPKR